MKHDDPKWIKLKTPNLVGSKMNSKVSNLYYKLVLSELIMPDESCVNIMHIKFSVSCSTLGLRERNSLYLNKKGKDHTKSAKPNITIDFLHRFRRR